MGNMSTISFTTNYPHRSDVYDNGDNHLYAGVLYRQMEVFFFFLTGEQRIVLLSQIIKQT